MRRILNAQVGRGPKIREEILCKLRDLATLTRLVNRWIEHGYYTDDNVALLIAVILLHPWDSGYVYGHGTEFPFN